MIDYDKRTTVEIENENLTNMAGYLFGAALIIVALGLIVGAIIYL